MNRDPIGGEISYECISEGNLLSLEKFRYYFIFILPLHKRFLFVYLTILLSFVLFI